MIAVLIVDDHAVVAEGFADLLSGEDDIEVVGIATSAASAVDALRERVPDVVLMDYHLPDLDGASLTARVKSEHPDVKVLMLTAEQDESVLVAAIEAGCAGYLTKSARSTDVVGAIRALHSGEALIESQMLGRLLPRLARLRRRPGIDLTPRETEILQLLADGLSNQAIADRLVLSLRTVRNHVQNVLTKLQVHSRLEAVVTAVREQLVRPPH